MTTRLEQALAPAIIEHSADAVILADAAVAIARDATARRAAERTRGRQT